MGSKIDIKRIYVMFFSVIFAILLKLAIDSIPMLSGIPVVVGFAISPLLALLISQSMIEKKIDGNEIGLFVLFMFLSNFIVQLFPTIRDFNLFNLTTATTIGIVVTVTTYLITIPISVLLSDMITDKGIKIFRR